MWFWIGAVLLVLLSFLIFRVIVKKDYRTGKLSPLSVVLEFLIFGLHANLPYLYLAVKWPEIPPLPPNRLQVGISLGILILGFLLTLGIMAYLGFVTSLGQGSEALRQAGPYRWSRNPQLISYSLVLVGLAILYPSLESGAWILIYCLIAQMMVLTEEGHLRSIFGNDYQSYCNRVPRYISFSRGGESNHHD
jgi:protein-S-isoprenylcysteine O-methyltransferase Ste14